MSRRKWGSERVGTLIRKTGKRTDHSGPEPGLLSLGCTALTLQHAGVHSALQVSSRNRHTLDPGQRVGFGQVERKVGTCQEWDDVSQRHEDRNMEDIFVSQRQTCLSRDKLCGWESGCGTRKVDWGKFGRPWRSDKGMSFAISHKKGELSEEPLCCIVQISRHKGNKQKNPPNPHETKIATQQPVLMKLQLHSPSGWNSALGSGRSLSGGHRGTRKGLSFGPSIILIDVVKKDSQRKWIYSGCDETWRDNLNSGSIG